MLDDSDVDVIVNASGRLIAFRRTFAVAFQLPPGHDLEQFIKEARPAAQAAFDKIVKLSNPKRIRFKKKP